MAASHQKQLCAWEQDRQRARTLEQRCTRLDGEDIDTIRIHKCLWVYDSDFSVTCAEELLKRNEVIRVLTKRVWVVESREKDVQKELSVAQRQLCELQQKQQNISRKCEDIEVPLSHSHLVKNKEQEP